MRVGYVVLYVKDPSACLKFWTEQIGMVEKDIQQAGDFSISKVGFADQSFSLELVPLELMKENPDGLDLATPSMAFHVEDLESTREKFISAGITVSEIADHGGTNAFAFSDNEGRWFAVTNG